MKPESLFISPSLYKDPTSEEILGLRNPFPADKVKRHDLSYFSVTHSHMKSANLYCHSS